MIINGKTYSYKELEYTTLSRATSNLVSECLTGQSSRRSMSAPGSPRDTSEEFKFVETSAIDRRRQIEKNSARDTEETSANIDENRATRSRLGSKGSGKSTKSQQS